ncbi:AAA family ATPase [Bordetella muralis]|uniref:trifunctional serine/threonine-protein kinase/ATP-binding protein/sensor histidine kinase n=1 Tax=Bordetella muralis TaxID=1649130 RepID=UPI0039EF4A43
MDRFLPFAIDITRALAEIHRLGLVHSNLQPSTIVVHTDDGIRLTASRETEHRVACPYASAVSENCDSTLAYIAPEQLSGTGWPTDRRSNFYSLGVIFYQMVVGALPFNAEDPSGWIHCHVARRPIDPCQRLVTVPSTVSTIIMRLLAKTPQERYQTAAGIISDLERCLKAWIATFDIMPFELAADDTPDELAIPDKLYGRDRELATMIDCLDRVARTGIPELLLIAGYSGTGKSALVEAMRKAVTPSRTLFASGKFEQYQENVPYATLIQALQTLVHSLLSKNESELTLWRSQFLQALGVHGELITTLIPDLVLIIGTQPPAPTLPLLQAQVRFHSVFQRFIGVFAQPEHPLVIFLDDLQWLDTATLELLEDLVLRAELKHLLLIGAYRDNEIASNQTLLSMLERVKAGATRVSEITLGPLKHDPLVMMLSETLRTASREVGKLAELIRSKTGANPYFVIQFLTMLAENSLIAFDHDRMRWVWDADRISTQRHTENVVELMIAKLGRLPDACHDALRLLACIGNAANMTTLSWIFEVDIEGVDALLWPARRQELVHRNAEGYRFSHDRVQEAALSRVPEPMLAQAKLRIGRLLLRHTPTDQREGSIFDIVNQLNYAVELIVRSDERVKLAELNLIAGRRAKASVAYASALNYFQAGSALINAQTWATHRELSFALEFHLAECEFVTGELAYAGPRLAALHERALTNAESSAVTCLRGEIYVTKGQHGRAVAVAVDYLRHTGCDWSDHPSSQDVWREHQRLRRRLRTRPIDTLRELPPMTQSTACATMEVLLQLAPAALAYDDNLLCLSVCRMVNLSLEYGSSDGACAAYVWAGVVLGPYLGDYKTGFRFAQLGLDLVDQRAIERFKARAYLLFGAHVNPWTRHCRDGLPLLEQAFKQANDIGDVTFAGYSCCNSVSTLLACGETLDFVERRAEFGLAYAREHGFRYVAELIIPQLQLIRMLRGALPVLGHFDSIEFNEPAYELQLQGHAIASCWYWIRKLQARYLAGDFHAALHAASSAAPLLWTSTSSLERVEYHFYSALAHAALSYNDDTAESTQHNQSVLQHHHQLAQWAENTPENFEDRAALVAAEIARSEGRTLDAMHLYERSVECARAHGFIHHEAIANELAADFYTEIGFQSIARTYIRESRHCYLRWGAMAKVTQLEARFPETLERLETTGTRSPSPTARLELDTVIKVSQAISGETIHDRLIDTLMRTAMEHAGAEKAVLLLMDAENYQMVAHATIREEAIEVQTEHPAGVLNAVPESVLRYVTRLGESVILDDASAPNTFSDDPYLNQNRVRSLLCLPLINRTRLIGLLYLENNLAARVFTTDKLAILKLVALQAAISLENTRLYRDIEERESRIQRLVQSDVICILIWDLDGRIIDANDAFLNMLQYDRADLQAGLRWFDMTPPDWQAVHLQSEAQELQSTGAMRAREKEFFRKDGSRVPVLIGAAVFESTPNQGVAYILDLTDLKHAEARARENEQRYRSVQIELAHANRRSTMGQLAGSIAHEINQPITATVINAQAALREMQNAKPDQREISDALKSIIKDGNRAGDIITRIRNLIKNSPASDDLLEINEPIQEVIELTQSEAKYKTISILAELGDSLPMVRGDKVQLQQVMLNLIVNAFEAMSTSESGPRHLFIRTVATQEPGVSVTVRDTGPGLMSQLFDEAFDAFFTTKPSGLGMGLSICRSIIESHGGKIWASPSQPHGVTFQFTLPAAE